MESHDLSQYVNAVFGFCMKRLNNIEDARDLSQEILCEAAAALKHTQVEYLNGWLWRIAHNRYCRFIRGKKRMTISFDGGAFDETAAEEEEDWKEELQAAFDALHTLSALHREIMVDFYVKGLSCDEIAKVHRLPSKTVRSRLFYGRDKLRKRWQIKMEENRIYSQQNWFLSGNGDVNPSLLQRQIVRSIVKACYEQFMTVEQLSLATGIPALYIEDELPQLLRSEILQRQSEKYRANIIVHRAGFAAEAEVLLLKHAQNMAGLVQSTLEKLMPSVRSVGFYGCSLPETRLWWSLIPMLMREACTLARSQTDGLARGSFPIRRDGSSGWLCAYDDSEGVHRFFSGCNAYYLKKTRFHYYWSPTLYSESLSNLLRKLENEDINLDTPQVLGEILLSECIRCDLIVRNDTGFSWNIPVFDAAQAAALQTILHDGAVPLAQALLPACTSLHTLMKMEVPTHLHDQIPGVFGIDFNSIIDMLCMQLMDKGILEQPASGIYAGQVIMLCPDEKKLQP
ncbi:MAG: sigma-70 family RNA polymerase sigma factor [Clostridia bacterium]|nr:sigma-70 family RNA polymerase sigma factor [Clostridia bacterium]